MFSYLSVAVLFIAFTAGSNDLTKASPIQQTNELNDQSKMVRDEIQDENMPEFKVSEADIARTKVNLQKKRFQLALYTMVTLAIIVVVIIVLIGLWKDPLCCVFFTLCPCCILTYPCLLFLSKKYSEPQKIMQNDLQKYIPGAFYNDDGLLKRYKPRKKEMECMANVMNIIETPEQNGRAMNGKEN